MHAIAFAARGDDVAVRIIAAGGDDLVELIQGYEQARHAHVDERLEQISSKPDLSPAAQMMVKLALLRRSRRR